MRLLIEYAWTGNVRELVNVVERALVMTDGAAIDVDQLPSAVRTPATPGLSAALATRHAGGPATDHLDLSVKKHTAVLERSLIKSALERTAGNRTRAAKLLELSHRALLYKIREYGFDQ